MNYNIIQESRIGGREINQDRAAWLATGDAVLMVVADGMGGHLQGEVAAQLAVDTVCQRFGREARPRLADPARFLDDALRHAHESIVRHAAACRIATHAAPRTTCIACIVQDGQASWAHAGDSRLYLVHDRGETHQRVLHTRDHSVVQRMVDDGMIGPEEAARHPLRNRVFSCLGGATEPRIDLSDPVSLQHGDLIALCTDGAWSPLGDALATELARSPLTSTVPNLLDAAERAAGPGADNLTLIAMRWEAPDPDVPTITLRAGEFDAQALPQISDDDIERAVADIRGRLPHATTGVSS
ncbi:MAG: serine/threonine-protein phosphatase [Sulfuritalea sp.]|jgi:serine/threonine protein phosphatase PrpC|nr:serine/threonine-protein phosphatase [Sulfuritalea sp.]MBK8760748.1 serine/threonine-protein phosphatase [Sulfuritalea sp.]MBK9351951.1 serine/threonine-protein phosphatase [Sulfuritalea sp.]MBP6637152.1 serine/threonine-protein phosphatase [Sulfuritalea sp.]MBP7423949.1 serine/threonine-protein phosphatase [Sulfuritalea sp.]